MGLSTPAFGADRSALILAAKAVRGLELTDAQQLFLSGDFSSRVEGGGRARNLITDAAAKYYWRWRPDWLLYAALSGTVTDSLDPDMQLLLGGDNGLRGYPLRYESGTSRGAIHRRAARIHRLVSVSAGAGRRRHLRRCGPNLGQRQSSATAIPGC